MSEIAKSVAKILLEIGAVTLSPKKPYKYASGIQSPIYCDNRLIMSYPEKRQKVIEYFKIFISENSMDFDVIAGTATAGIPHAAWLAASMEKPMIYVRKESKEHGKENTIEGKLEQGQRVLVIEDLVSTGGSSLAAVQSVRDRGAIVTACISIFTYGMEKAKKRFDDAGCKLLAISDFNTLIEVAAEMGKISDEDKKAVLQWNKDPAGWAKKMGFD